MADLPHRALPEMVDWSLSGVLQTSSAGCEGCGVCRREEECFHM